MSSHYSRMVRTLSWPPKLRREDDCAQMEAWFRKKSKILNTLNRETLMDVIQHCDFVTRNRDDTIIQQGEKGHRIRLQNPFPSQRMLVLGVKLFDQHPRTGRWIPLEYTSKLIVIAEWDGYWHIGPQFYIILRGSVAVYLYKDGTPEDMDLGQEPLEARQIDRSILGFQVATLVEGLTFGEIALINTDCIRTASIIAEETTDLVVITRDLYNRSVSKVVAREYDEKVKFIESLSLFSSWSPRLKKQMAVSLRKEMLNFDHVLVKQGDPANDLYFIVKGEVKLMLDVESHYQQYEKLFGRCSDLMDAHKYKMVKDGHFPQKLLPQLEKINRMNKASMIKNLVTGGGQLHMPVSWSPSVIRKMNLEMCHKKVNINLCFLGQKQIIGDVEFLLGLDSFHHTALCSRETTVMVLHKTHFDRLFRKRSPRTLTEMGKMMETQLTLRCLKPNILETAPVLRIFLYRLQELNGERKHGDEKSFLTTLRNLSMNFVIDASSRLPQAPQTRSLVSSPQMNCDTPDLAHAQLHSTSPSAASNTSQYSRSKIILIPKVQA